jgi:hypothetical protein
LVYVAEQRLASSQDDEGFSTMKPEKSDITQRCLLNINKRFRLEKAADLLLLFMQLMADQSSWSTVQFNPLAK